MSTNWQRAWGRAGRTLRQLQSCGWTRLPLAKRLHPLRMWLRKLDGADDGLTTAEAIAALELDKKAGRKGPRPSPTPIEWEGPNE